MAGGLNCILIVVDTLRADHLGCYGYFRDTSPNIDRLAREGVLFKDMHASAIPTGPGFTSIITGLSPIHHHYYLTPWNIPNLIDFDDAIPTLPELIQDLIGGYTTAAFDNLMNFSSHMDHMVRGFEYYVNVTRTSKPIHHHVRGDQVNSRLIPWLRAHRRENFFVFVHYWDPHTPYNQPEEFRSIFHHEPGRLDDLEVKTAPAGYRYVPGWGRVGELWEPRPEEGKPTIDLYDGEIRFVDSLIGEVVEALEELDISDKTVVIITSDHGEQLGQHGLYDHRGLHESVVYIPLVIWAPAMLPTGKIVEGYVQQADIAPTILSILGAGEKDLPTFDGVDLLPIIDGEKPPRDEIYIENHEQRAVVEGEWKYIRNYFERTEELYNLEDDPMEVVNLAAEERSRVKAMREKLFRWVDENLKGRLDPMWVQMARWAAKWAATFKYDFPDLRPRPTIIREAKQ
ncbi:MAG: Arylsulfatase A [Candidatus Bathyarchaeota archaeon B24]|nr:MAG: Arylsulfatase A [Candidatus Bathyarchaeota archaeon B24]